MTFSFAFLLLIGLSYEVKSFHYGSIGAVQKVASFQTPYFDGLINKHHYNMQLKAENGNYINAVNVASRSSKKKKESSWLSVSPRVREKVIKEAHERAIKKKERREPTQSKKRRELSHLVSFHFCFLSIDASYCLLTYLLCLLFTFDSLFRSIDALQGS